jgi:Sec-independent protein translocase protein TatA
MSEQLAAVAWIEKLPNEGGDWGRGVIGTVRALEDKVAELELGQEDLDRQLAEFTKKVKEHKAAMDADIKVKRKLMKKTIKRAEAEVSTLYANAQIEAAKCAVGNGAAVEAEG